MILTIADFVVWFYYMMLTIADFVVWFYYMTRCLERCILQRVTIMAKSYQSSQRPIREIDRQIEKNGSPTLTHFTIAPPIKVQMYHTGL